MPSQTRPTRRPRSHPPSQAESEAIDEQSRTHTRPGRAGSRRSQAKRGNTTSNTISVCVRAPGDAAETTEAARYRARIVALQEQLAVVQARKDAEAEKQHEEKARRKQELKARRRAEMEEVGLHFDPASPRTSELGREDTGVAALDDFSVAQTKLPKLEHALERQQEMFATILEMQNFERMMQMTERMSNSMASAPPRRYRSRSRSRSPTRHRSSHHHSQRRRSRSPPRLPSRSHSPSPHRHRQRNRFPGLPLPPANRSRYRTPPPPPDPTTSSPFPSFGHEDIEIIEKALGWHIDRQVERKMKARWRMARIQILSRDWNIADCKALRDPSSEEYRTATTSMNISLQIVREIPRLLDEYKDVYCEQTAAYYEGHMKEARRREAAAASVQDLVRRG